MVLFILVTRCGLRARPGQRNRYNASRCRVRSACSRWELEELRLAGRWRTRTRDVYETRALRFYLYLTDGMP